MSGIPTYTQSPINAAKPSGITPRTASPPTQSSPLAPPLGSTAGPTTASADSHSSGYPAARPGAAAVPAATARAELHIPGQQQQTVPPTRTAALPEFSGPPPPQPGPLPVAPASYAFEPRFPPPPRAGETSQHGITSASAVNNSPPGVPYPAQMGMPPPHNFSNSGTQPLRTSNGSVMARYSGQHVSMPLLKTEAIQGNMLHPYGYMQKQQPLNAERSQATGQAPAWTSHHNSSQNQGPFGGGEGEAEGEGVWDTTKKWAKAVANRASEAESQLWRTINKE
ncbi:MAG: hypothetical protein M1829_001050 [Trizodia sp. TS-e1964]|nr:MAG: hypothetical protein M1829_001050 [Trizodia sp. TS-e1964]